MSREGDPFLCHEAGLRPSAEGRTQHAAYWHGLRLPGYEGGPFADRSGGLITFEAGSVEEAARIVASDPFVREALLETSVVKQWVPE